MHFKFKPILLCSALLLTTMGCHSAHVTESVTAKLGANDADTQLDFWHTLADHNLTSNDDALHGMLLYLDNKDDCADYNARVSLLKSRGLLPNDFNAASNEAVRRGTVAVMFVKTLSLKGGWAMHVFGPTPRYAVRELQYLSIFPYSSPQQTFSGTEFVGVIGALEDYQNQNQNLARPPMPPTTLPAASS